MATIYIFEGLDAKRQQASAERYASHGIAVDVHFHHAWEKPTENLPAARVECNLMCYKIENDVVTYIKIKEE